MVWAAPALELIAPLFEYPAPGCSESPWRGGSPEHFLKSVLGTAAALRAASPRAADLVGAFADAIATLRLAELEELYIQTFDLNPDACLDIGWHLFGEDYARGEFLVNLRQQMRRYGIAERQELPDNLLAVLPLAARLPEAEAAAFGARFLRPAVDKIRQAVPAGSNPYARLLEALAVLLGGEGCEAEHRERRERK